MPHLRISDEGLSKSNEENTQQNSFRDSKCIKYSDRCRSLRFRRFILFYLFEVGAQCKYNDDCHYDVVRHHPRGICLRIVEKIMGLFA